MSMCYWMIEGIGIDVEKIRPHLNNRKLINFLVEQYPEEEEILYWKGRRDVKSFDIDDYLHGDLFDNLAELLTHCDDTDTLTFGDDGDGGVYFYYPPSMPWHRRDNEPQSPQEVHERIIDAVMVITDLSEAEIEAMIDDDIYAVGCG